jgi:hypothetical protein
MNAPQRRNPGNEGFAMQIEPHRAGWRVHVTGGISLANTIAYWTRILDRVRADPRPVLLIDEMHGHPLDAGDWKELVAAMEGTGLEAVRIAHVKPRGLDSVEYCEIYAREAGFDARVFTDENTAALWLRHGEER